MIESKGNKTMTCPNCNESLFVSLEDDKKLCKSCNTVLKITEDVAEMTEEKYLTED